MVRLAGRSSCAESSAQIGGFNHVGRARQGVKGREREQARRTTSERGERRRPRVEGRGRAKESGPNSKQRSSEGHFKLIREGSLRALRNKRRVGARQGLGECGTSAWWRCSGDRRWGGSACWTRLESPDSSRPFLRMASPWSSTSSLGEAGAGPARRSRRNGPSSTRGGHISSASGVRVSRTLVQ